MDRVLRYVWSVWVLVRGVAGTVKVIVFFFSVSCVLGCGFEGCFGSLKFVLVFRGSRSVFR